MDCKKGELKIFDKYFENDNFVYLPISIDNKDQTIADCFNFFFSEETLYFHYKVLTGDPLLKNDDYHLSLLYRNLLKFIDKEIRNFDYDYSECSDEIKKIIESENKLFKNHDIRRDKIGKIGEYLMSIVLEKSFGFDVVLRKSDLTSSYNMSVYGIDTIHYQKDENKLLFGESKFTSSLKNGLKLIDESLTFYERRIKDEIELIFTIDKMPLLNLPKDIFKNSIETFLSVEKFIEETKTTCIGIPLFIAHGNETNPIKILEEMKKIERKKFLGLDTKYYVISMPIGDATIFVKGITRMIKEKVDLLKKEMSEHKDEHIG